MVIITFNITHDCKYFGSIRYYHNVKLVRILIGTRLLTINQIYLYIQSASKHVSENEGFESLVHLRKKKFVLTY